MLRGELFECRSQHLKLDPPCGSELMMQPPVKIRWIVLFGLILFSAGYSLAQGTSSPASKILVVNGKTVDVEVKDIQGRSYVDVETLAQITSAVVTVEPNRIVLTIPAPNTAATSAAAATNAGPQPPPGLSRDFASAAVSTLADMREWRGAISMMIIYGLVVSASWSSDYHDRVEADLAQAAVAATTDADQSALPLLRNESEKLNSWANDVLAARQSLNGAKTVDPNALKNDPSLAKITDCGRFLNGMIVSRVFSDSASCH
jgi:hypothetical protein